MLGRSTGNHAALCVPVSGADPWEELDGRLNAPAGTPNFPNLLDEYGANRPPWQVAGVDYLVGITPGTTLKNPATGTLPPNCSRDIGNQWFVVEDDTTVDGWDFSDWQVLVYNGTNVAVLNCKFTVGLLLYRDDGTSSGAIIRYCEFDRQNVNSVYAAPVELYRGGDFIVEYCLFLNSYGEFTQCPVNATKTLTYRYNLLMNSGGGSDQGAHGDWVQLFGTATVPSLIFEFNCGVQNIEGYATQGFSVQNNPTIESGRMSNNTVIAKTNINYPFTIGRYWCSGTFYIRDNYVDPTFAIFGLVDFGLTAGPYDGSQFVQSGNKNMLTGTFPAAWNP